MKTRHYILIVIAIVLLGWLLPQIINNKVGEDEIWYETYQIQDGSSIRIIHSHNCKAKKPFFAWNVQCKILHYHKEKIDVFDYCINEDDANMLNYISKRNIKKALDLQWAYAEDSNDRERCLWHEKMWDTTFRMYEVAYSMINGELHPQNDDGKIINDYSWETHFVKSNNEKQ